MTAAFDQPSEPGRRQPLTVDASAKVPADAEVVGIGVVPGARSVKPPGGSAVDGAFLALRGFDAKPGQTVVLPGDGVPVLLAIGLGSPGDLPPSERVRLAAAALVRAAGQATSVAFLPGTGPDGLAPAEAAQAAAEGACLATYRYQGFRSSVEGRSRVRRFILVGPKPKELSAALRRGAAIASAVAFVRDLVNEPPGSLTPTRLADIASSMASERGLGITVYDGGGIGAQRLGALAGVARGSDQEARFLRIEYNPGAGRRGALSGRPARPPTSARAAGGVPTVALVGKGITFDSGGLSLKSGEGMMTMKNDMAGAAVVLGAMSLLGELDVPVRVIGFAPLTENMPGGRAIKPGDVLRARNGKTIEVLNTDAEGRLVLADALSMAAEESPDAIVDLATLTGAVVVALGKHIAGIMGNDDALVARVEAAGARASERLWRLPLPADYRRDIDSEVADMKNIGNPSQAGSVIAGLFLQEFVAGIPWAHLDIAGTAFGDTDRGYLTKGATGFGVRTIIELLESYRSDR